MTEEKKEVAEVLLANRVYLYSLLQKVFGRAPDQELLDILTAENTERAFGILSEEPDDTLARSAEFLAKKRAQKDEPGFLEKVEGEYTRLFVGPDRLPAPPWESVYRGEDAMLFQEVTLRVRETYKSFGLIPAGYPHVADDSLALELDFMAQLSQKSLDAFHADDEEKLQVLLTGSEHFLSDHLLRWIPEFLERMAKADSRYLYPQMCLILDSFIKTDHVILTELLKA